jgi:hypothetical protein
MNLEDGLDILMRWTGTELVPVACVNRVVIENIVATGGLLNQPTYGSPKTPPSQLQSINVAEGLGVSYSYDFLDD